MGIISPCGTGPSPVYADSGFLLGADYWRWLQFLLVGVPILLFLI